MIAFRVEKALRCQTCGTAEWEWDPKQGGSKFAYEPVLHTCPGCQAREIMTNDGEQRPPGATVVLRPTRTIEWAQSMLKRQRRSRRKR